MKLQAKHLAHDDVDQDDEERKETRKKSVLSKGHLDRRRKGKS